MDFKNNIFSLQYKPNSQKAHSKIKLPDNKDYYFRAKQNEIID